MKKNKKIKRISFLKKRKNLNDMFFDLAVKMVKYVPEKYKNGKVKKDKFKRVGITEFAKTLKITIKQADSYLKRGYINDELYHLTRNIEINHKKLKIKKTKIVTKEYTVHNFTRDNFFPRKKFVVKKNEQLYFRAGLYLEFSKVNKNDEYTDSVVYTIQNFPISHKSNSYPEGYDEFFEIIKIELESHPSLKLFRFNYFDVQKIDISKINEDFNKKFVAKYSKRNNKKNGRK